MTGTSKENNKAVENLNDRLLEIKIYRCINSIYLTSLLFKITNHEQASPFKLVKCPDSNRVKDLSIKEQYELFYDILLTFRDTGKKFDVDGDLLKLKTNKN